MPVRDNPVMARKHQPSFFEALQRGTYERVFSIRQPELLILRGHGVIEAALVSILAMRLRVEEQSIPSTNFDTLARLALCGAAFDLMLQPVLHVNRLRNVVAHELELVDPTLLMEKFVATMPPTLADATKPPHEMLLIDAFAAALMVLTYALLQIADTVVKNETF
jgi:hypothetical protein